MESFYKSWKYPGGEVGVRLTGRVPDTITFNISSSDDVMKLFMLIDSMRRHGQMPREIVIPYLPYARQDRVCSAGDSYSLQVFVNLLTSLDLYGVTISTYDVHSDVARMLFKRAKLLKNGPQFVNMMPFESFRRFVHNINGSNKPVNIVVPDDGATERCEIMAEDLIESGFASTCGFVYADKVRDPETGKLHGIKIKGTSKLLPYDAPYIIFDDICDGGGTFLLLHDVLTREYQPYNISLYTTHGLYSKGTKILTDVFNSVGCFNYMGSESIENTLLI